MVDYPNINVNASATPGTSGFSALVKVTKSRYEKIVYPEDMKIPDTIGIMWEFLSPKGKTFNRTYSTGLHWTDAQVSADGKHITANFKPGSDAAFLIKKAIASTFPASKIANDISVFEGECFFVADDKNPNASSSKAKPYPKTYHPEGWDRALAEHVAKQIKKGTYTGAGTQNAQATLQKTTEVPKVMQIAPNVLSAAVETLHELLAASGGQISQEAILGPFNKLADTKTHWQPDFRQQVTFALWYGAGGNLQAVVASDPRLALVGDTVTLKG